MARRITVTFADGSSHVYENAPDDISPQDIVNRATREFSKPVKALDGGRGTIERAARAVGGAVSEAFDGVMGGNNAISGAAEAATPRPAPQALDRSGARGLGLADMGNTGRSLGLPAPVAKAANERGQTVADRINAPATIETDGYLDRQGVKIKQTMAGIGSGIVRAVAADTQDATSILPESFGDYLTQKADNADRYINAQVKGGTEFDDIMKAEGVLGKVGKAASFMAEEIPASLAYVPLLMSGLGTGAIVTSQAGNIGQDRADNNGTGPASSMDIAAAAPAAIASTALDKFGFDRMLGGVGKNVVSRIGNAAMGEGLTEGVQGIIEYAGGTIGTDKDFDVNEAGRQAASGALVGFGAGGAFRGVGEVVDAARGPEELRQIRNRSFDGETALEAIINSDPNGYDPFRTVGLGFDENGRIRARRAGDTRTPGPGIVEATQAGAANLSPEDLASPLDNADLAAGMAELAKPEAAGQADAALSEAGLPKVGSQVNVAGLPGGGTMSGTIEDVFSDDTGTGVVVRPTDGGKPMREYLDTLNELGVSITAFDPLAEADTIDATLAALASEPVGGSSPLPAAGAETPSPRPSGRTPSTGAGGVNFDMGRYMARTRGAESSGNDNAKAGTSSATGRYQFTDGTWLGTYREVFGNTGESEAQILAKRTDGAVQDKLMQRLTQSNVNALQKAGLPVNDGTAYLAHFAGVDRAKALLTADPNTPVADVLGAKAVAANPFLKGKTASQVVAWANKKMGGAGVGGMASDSGGVPDIPTQWAELPESAPIRSSEAPAPDLPEQSATGMSDEEWDSLTSGPTTIGAKPSDRHEPVFDESGNQTGWRDPVIAKQFQEEAQKKDAQRTEQRREEAQSAVDKRNSYRKRFTDWFNSASEGAEITDSAGSRWRVVEGVSKAFGKTKRLVAVDNDGNINNDFITGISVNERTASDPDWSRDTGFDPDNFGQQATTTGQDRAEALGRDMADTAGSAAGAVTPPEPVSNPDKLPAVAKGSVRLWRGNRPGEVGQNPQFTNDLEGIARPFQQGYGGPLSYVDVPSDVAEKALNRTGAAATGAEFILPPEWAARATIVDPGESNTPRPQQPRTEGAPQGWGSTDDAPAAPTASTPTPTARVEETSTGKSVAVIGASEAELAAIAKAVPKAKATPPRSDGAILYSKKYEAEIRAALASVAPAPVKEPRKLTDEEFRAATAHEPTQRLARHLDGMTMADLESVGRRLNQFRKEGESSTAFAYRIAESNSADKLNDAIGKTQNAARGEQGVSKAVTPKGSRQGEIGMQLAAGEVVRTTGGRDTTPFPKIAMDTDRKAGNTLRNVDKWLAENALAEAEARGDDFNAPMFRRMVENPRNISQSDKDSAEQYLFGEQPPVLPPLGRPMDAAPARPAPKSERPLSERDPRAYREEQSKDLPDGYSLSDTSSGLILKGPGGGMVGGYLAPSGTSGETLERAVKAAKQAAAKDVERRAKMGAKQPDRSAAIIMDPAAGTVKTVPLGTQRQEARKDGVLAWARGEKRVNASRADPAVRVEWYAGWDSANLAAPVEGDEVYREALLGGATVLEAVEAVANIGKQSPTETPNDLEDAILALSSDDYVRYLEALKPPRNPNRNAISSRAAQIQRQFNTTSEKAMRDALASVVESTTGNAPQVTEKPATAPNLKPTDQATIDLLTRMAEAEDRGSYVTIEIGSLRVKMMVAEGLIIENKGKSDAMWITSEKGRNLLDDAGVPHAQSPKPAQPSRYAKNTIVSEDKIAAARKRMAERMGRLNAGFDPEMALDGMIIAAGEIEAGVRNFAEFAKNMRDAFGKNITPYLLSFWESARAYPGLPVEGMTDATTSKAMHEMMLAGLDETGAAAAPAATEATDPTTAVRDHFLNGGRFATIVEARKFLSEQSGETIRPGTPEAKRADETIEAAIVQAARSIAARNEGNPIAAYRALVDLYERQPNLSVRSSTSVEQQAYSTPVPLAYLASRRAGINQLTMVYEPSAGNGALLIDTRATFIRANELNPERAQRLRENYPGAKVSENDAMANPDQPRGYDVMIANPPFGPIKDEDGENKVFNLGNGYETREIDHAISMKALEAIKSNGRAVLIVGSINKQISTEKGRADAYNAKAKREFYYRLYNEYNVTDHFTVAGELYTKQGAGWPVDVIVIEGRGKSALPLPAVKPPRVYDSWTALETEVEQSPSVQPATGTTAGSIAGQGTETTRSDGRGSASSTSGRPDRLGQPATAQQPGDVRAGSSNGEPNGGRLDGAQARNDAQPDADNRAGTNRRPPQVKREAVAGENARQVTYQPASSAKSLDTLVPVNMQTAISNALGTLENRVGAVDTYVADRLGFDPKDIATFFSAEQVDALGLAIDNMERGAGFIIGDQTGIGKGRVVAGVIRYALRSGRMPIFVTEKPNLYADMYRDMNDVGIPKMLGRPVDILMTNAAEKVPLNEDGSEELKTGSAAKHNEVLNRVADGDREGVDVLFTTYSQMQSMKGEWTPRQRAIERLASGSIIIFDESHNAGGQGKGANPRKSKKQKEAEEAGVTAPNRAEFARQIAKLAHGVFFSSATYAKRPDVMDLYASTDMRYAVSDIDKLGDAIAKGGIPMQQVVASMLTESGQYVRRERSFDGVEYRTPAVPVDRASYSQFTGVLRSIQDFQEQHVSDAVEAIADDIRSEAQAVSFDGSIGGAGATSTNFTSVMHNVVEQMLLAMKAAPAAARAVELLQQGKKPVITVANTMGSFIEEYAAENNIGNGQPMPIDFRSLLVRYLDRTREINIKRPFSKDKAEKRWITDEELGGAGAQAYYRVREMIDAMDLSAVPVSPVDYIRNEITKAGFRVSEITGRSATLDYSNKTPRYRIRPGKEKSILGRREAITGFNGGTIDAMILNQAGSTGLSLHASATFKDKRTRVMIIAQAERNIDTHMQMLGRIHRTGQVVLPEYDQLVAAVPAEMRPAAVLAKKMASLNANTTGARDSAMTGDDVPDFMNEYGDEIAARMMEEDDALHRRLGEPVKGSDGDKEGLKREDAARKVTGRLMLLPLEEQEAFYESFLSEYRDYLAQKEAAGEATLEAKTLDIDAKVLASQQVVDQTQPNTPFGEAVYQEVLDIKRLGKPLQPDQIVQDIEQAIDSENFPSSDAMGNMAAIDTAGSQWMQEFKAGPIAAFDAYRRETLDGMDDAKVATNAERMQANLQAFTELTRVIYPGAAVQLVSPDGDQLRGVVLSVDKKGATKNPLALGSFRATFAFIEATGRTTVPFSQLRTDRMPESVATRTAYPIRNIDGIPVLQAFSEMQVEAREKRVFLTGNILAAYEHTGNKGQIVNFVDSEGAVRPGLMMRRGWDYAKEMAKRPVPFRTPEQVLAWLNEGETALADSIKIERIGDRLIVTTAAAKSVGGKFFLDKSVLAAIGGDFYKKSTGMVAETTMDRARQVIAAIQSAGATFTAKTNLDRAREIVAGSGGARQSIPETAPIIPAAKIAGKTWQERRMAALQWYNRNLVGTTVTTAEGMKVQFTKRSGDKTTTQKGDRLLAAVPAIAQIIERGTVVSRAAGSKPGMQEVLWISAPVQLADGVTDIAVIVRRQNNGTYQYAITDREFAPVQTESDGAQSVPTMEGSGAMGLNLFEGVPSGKSVSSTDVAQLESNLQERLESYGIARKVALRIVDTLGGAAGEYRSALMKIATDTTQAETFTLDHEVIHALREMGLFNTSEWAILSAKARRDPGLMRSIRQRYEAGFRKRGMSGAALEEALIEEAVSDLFARYQRGDYKAEGTIARVFKALRQAIEAIANYVQQRGARTAEGVMSDVASGQVGTRETDILEDPKSPRTEVDSERFAIPERDDLVALGGTEPTWKGKGAEAFDKWRTAMQDRYLPLLKVQRQIEEQTGKSLPVSRNPYMGEELMTGRIGARLEKLAEENVQPLFDAMHADKVSTEELESFLYARHAPERNARIAEINPEFTEGEGSGMTDLEAAAIMSRIRKAGKMEAMERLAARVDQIRDDALEYRVQTGLISKADVEEWKSTYQFYVPLRGFKETGTDAIPERMNRSGGGINVRGRESKQAFGRRSQADSPLAYLILQAEEAIVRGETNIVAARFYNLAKANPDDAFWKINKASEKKRINEESGLVESYLSYNLAAEDADWTVSAKINGKQVRVTMSKQNVDARRLADAMRNLTQHQMDWVTLHMGKVNRFLSAVNTSYNPEFIITNAFRDIQTAAFNLSGEQKKGLVKGTLKDYRSALAVSMKGAFGKHSGEWGKWYDEFTMNGGRVYFNKVENVEEIKGRIAKAAEMAQAKAGEGGTRLQAKRMFLAARDFIENTNNGVENAVRLAVYKNAREAGLTPTQSASMAKNVTVNFNRRGTAGPAMNAAYLFFNASVQGSTRIIMALRSPRVRKMVAGMMITAAAVEMLNAMMSADDDDGESIYDKIPAFDKSRNIVLMMPDGKSYIKIPMPYGYNAFWEAGRSAAEIGRRGGGRWKETMGQFVGTVAGAFNPIGGSGSLLNMLSPTITDPIVDLTLNKDFTDKPIMPNQSPYGPEEPDNQRYFNSIGPHWRAITDFFNTASGGDEVMPGAIDVSPETLEYLAGTVVGSAGGFLDRIATLVGKGFDEGEEVTANDIPLARKVIGSKPAWVDKAAYYDRVNRVEQEMSYVEDYLDAGSGDEARTYAEKNRNILTLEGAAKQAKKDMRDVRKARREIVTAKERKQIDDATYRQKKEVIDRADKMVVTEFNTAWVQAMQTEE